MVCLLTIIGLVAAHADTTTTLSEDAIAAINSNKTVVENILKAAFGLVLAFLLFRWIKRGTNKA
jgi:hypothetical protein